MLLLEWLLLCCIYSCNFVNLQGQTNKPYKDMESVIASAIVIFFLLNLSLCMVASTHDYPLESLWAIGIIDFFYVLLVSIGLMVIIAQP